MLASFSFNLDMALFLVYTQRLIRIAVQQNLIE